LKFNITQDKTVVEFCKTVVATAQFLVPIWLLLVSVALLCSREPNGTKIGIKKCAVAITV
jgi:hypothetical protein